MQFAQKSRSLLPLDRANGLGREVVANAANAGNLGGDAGGDALEQRPVELGTSAVMTSTVLMQRMIQGQS